MARMIDKNELITSMAWHDQQGMISSIDDVLDIIEAYPTLTPQNEWVSVEDAMPPELKMVLVYSCGLYDVAGWVKDEHGEICWTCKTVPEFWRPIPEME